MHDHEQVIERYRQTDPDSVYLSDITVAELLKGRLSHIKEYEVKGGLKLAKAYGYLRLQLEVLEDMNILPYNMEADTHFAAYDAEIRRAGTNDCRIAAIAHVQGLIVGRRTAATSTLSVVGTKTGREPSNSPAQTKPPLQTERRFFVIDLVRICA